MKRVLKYIGIALVYALFLFEIVHVLNHPMRCAYEEDISVFAADTVVEAQKQYLYMVEESAVDEDDPFRIVSISGWLITNNESGYEPVPARLVLRSGSRIYAIHTYSIERPDIYYLDQSGRGTNNLYAGYLGRFPADALEAGEYQIGFLIEEDDTQAFFWTENRIEIKAL